MERQRTGSIRDLLTQDDLDELSSKRKVLLFSFHIIPLLIFFILISILWVFWFIFLIFSWMIFFVCLFGI